MNLKRTLWRTMSPLVRGVTYRFPYAGVKMIRRGGFGFMTRIYRKPTEEELFLAALDLRGQTVYDIGGHVGMLSVFFSHAVGDAGHVVTFEPNPANCDTIRKHLTLNRVENVELLEMALGDSAGEGTLVVGGYGTATGSLNTHIQRALESQGDCSRIGVRLETLDRVRETHALPAPDFVKIDVEGLELPVLRGMCRTITESAPVLFVEIHGAGPSDSDDPILDLLALLESWEYSAWHVEGHSTVGRSTTNLPGPGEHLYCQPASRILNLG